MLSEKQAGLAIRILSLLLAAALSFFVATAKIPESKFVTESVESVEESSETVMKLSAATLAASLAISALPDDFASPLAESLTDMNVYFIGVLIILFLEKILLGYGIKIAFAIIIPLACLAGIAGAAMKQDILKAFAIRLCILGLAAAFVVPCSTHITGIVAADLTDYVYETIEETEGGADKLNEAMEGDTGDKTIFERLSELFQTAIRGISDLMVHFQNMIRKCMNSIAILILTNCLMPLLTFFILRWILKETFQVVIPLPPIRRRRKPGPESVAELAAAGEK